MKVKLDPKQMVQEDEIIKMAVKKKIDSTLFNHRAQLIKQRRDQQSFSYYNMQDDDEISKYVIALSEKYQVLCEKTAYILVIQENKNDGEKAKKVDIPNPKSEDYKA